MLGGAGDDRLVGDLGDDAMDGGDGKDHIDGGQGNDYAYGGAGNDTILLRQGDDRAEGADGADRIYGHAGNDELSGGAGNDLIDGGTDDDVIDGGVGDDTLIGGSGHDVVTGGDGADKLYGYAGNDQLDGGADDDFINGHSGFDVLTGGDGSDQIFGGSGTDVAVFDGLLADYQIAYTAFGVSVTGFGYTDNLTQVEFIEFDDGIVNLAQHFNIQVEPFARDDEVSMLEGTTAVISVLSNDLDDGAISLHSVGNAAHGAVTVSANGQIEYTSDTDFFGEDAITYEIIDGQGNISSATIAISVQGINDGPQAVADVLYLDSNELGATGNLLANDTDIEGDSLSALPETGVSTGGGTYSIAANGDVIYQAPPGFEGTDTFSYTVLDSQGGQSVGSVTVTTDPGAAPPPEAQREIWVGDGEEYSSLRDVAQISEEGDIIYVRAGTYYDDFATFNHSVSIIGVGGMAHFIWVGDEEVQGGHLIPNGKGIINIESQADYVHVENLILEGAVVGDRNGAGIRHQGKDVSVVNTQFINNQNGILAVSNDPSATVTVVDSYFDGNGYEDGLAHALYIKDAGTLIVDNTVIVNTVVGHHVKSMAANTIITNSTLDDGTGTSSFAVDVSKGGDLLVQDNLIIQTDTGLAPPILSYSISRGGDAGTVLIKGNTVINESQTGLLIRNDTTAIATIEDNIFTNIGDGHLRMSDGLAALVGNTMDGMAIADMGAEDGALNFTEGDDVVQGSYGEDFYSLGGGNDTATMIQGNDVVLGGEGDDLIYGGHGFDNIYGDAGDDLLVGAGSDDLLAAGAGNDLLYGGVGADTMLGGSGNDIFVGAVGGDVINGGAGMDIAVYRGVFADYIYTVAGGRHFFNGGQDKADWGRDALINIEKAQFLDGVLDLDTGAWSAGLWIIDPLIFEGPYDPSDPAATEMPSALTGLGLPVISGTNANLETVTGSADDEILTSGGGTADLLVGGAGDDIYVSFGVTTRVLELAGEGIDTLVVLSDWGRLEDNMENLELMGTEHSSGYGNELDNVLLGNAGRNRLEGAGGDDLLDGGAGNDILVGGDGADRFRFTGPNPGADWIIAFDGANDVVQIEQALVGSASVADVLAAAVESDYGTRIDIGDFHLTFGKLDPSDLTLANFELI